MRLDNSNVSTLALDVGVIRLGLSCVYFVLADQITQFVVSTYWK
jgi:hypothetical protein